MHGDIGITSRPGDGIYRNIRKEEEKQSLNEDVQVVKTGCFGFCERGPVVKVLPEETFYVEPELSGLRR